VGAARGVCAGRPEGQAGSADRQSSVSERPFVDARLGNRWPDLPRPLGRHEAVKRRYYRWIEMGVLDQILAALAREADLECPMIDSAIVRAHQHAAGARRQKGGRMPRALVAPAEACAPKSTPPAMRWEIRCA
jgi:transposase